MAFVIDPRVKETTSTTGGGTYDLGGAVSGFQTFVAGIGTTNTTFYYVTDGTDWEHGVGTVTDASPDTLSRDTVLASSNAGAAVNWGAGSKDVFCDISYLHFRYLATASDAEPFYSEAIVADGTGGMAVGDGAHVDAAGIDSYAIGSLAYINEDTGAARAYNCSVAGKGSYCDAVEGNVTAGGTYCWLGGKETQADRRGEQIWGSGMFAAKGDAQAGRIHLMAATTDATATNLHADESATDRITIQVSSSESFIGHVKARQHAGTAGTAGDSKSWKFEGIIKRDGAGNTALVSAVTPTEIDADAGAAAWTLAVTADDTNEALQIQFTGEADKSIRISGVVEMLR